MMPGESGRAHANGWYSRKHKTGEAHQAVVASKEAREAAENAAFWEREEARAERSDEEQLKLLDERFGKDQGAKKERARLKARIAVKKTSGNGNGKRLPPRNKKEN